MVELTKQVVNGTPLRAVVFSFRFNNVDRQRMRTYAYS